MQKHWDGMVRLHVHVRARALIFKNKNWQSFLGNLDFTHT